MMNNNGWIKLHRSLLEWEWYSDNNVFRVFTHILLKANFEDRNWQGKIVKRGQLITSRGVLAKEVGLTEQQVRTALTKLKSTNEITIQATNGYTAITVVKYSDYQNDENDNNQPRNQEDNQRITNEQPTDNQRITTTKELKNLRIKEDNNISSLRSDILQKNPEIEKLKKFVKPTIAEIELYCKSRNNHVLPEKFFDFYESKGWKIGSNLMKDWQAAVRTWERGSATTATAPRTVSAPQAPHSTNKNLDELYASYDHLGIPYTKPEGVK